MNLIKQIENDIKNNTYSPVYLFMGEEEYYIDYLTKLIQNNSLQDHEKDFNLNILYGKDTLIRDIISISKQYPVMSERKLVIVKEAQDLLKKDAEGNSLDDLINYVNNPLTSTILVLNFKHKSLDKRKVIYKAILKNGLVYESKKLYENQIADYADTGAWSNKAIKEAGNFGEVNVICSSKDSTYNHIPKKLEQNFDSTYLHLTSNNTIYGTQWKNFPIPLNKDSYLQAAAGLLQRQNPNSIYLIDQGVLYEAPKNVSKSLNSYREVNLLDPTVSGGVKKGTDRTDPLLLGNLGSSVGGESLDKRSSWDKVLNSAPASMLASVFGPAGQAVLPLPYESYDF